MGTRIIPALLALCLVAAPARADDLAAADALNTQARAAYDAGDFSGALALFKEAWGTAHLPKYLFNAAKACVRLEDPEAALYYYRRYLAAAPAAGDAQDVQKEMKALRGTLHARGLIHLEVRSDPSRAALPIDGVAHPEVVETPAERWLPPGDVVVAFTLEGRTGAARTVTLAPDRKSLVRLELPALPERARVVADAPAGARITVGDRTAAPMEALTLPPGDHVVRVELAGHQTYLDTVTLVPGEEVRVSAAPVPLPPPTAGRGQRIAGWTTLAAGGAALVAGGVMAGLGVKGMQDANATHDSPDGGYVREYGESRNLYHGGLGTLGGGAVAAVTGGLLLLLAPEEAERE